MTCAILFKYFKDIAREEHMHFIIGLISILLSLFSMDAKAQDANVSKMGPRIGACLQLANAGIGHAHIVNSCNSCRTAVMSWCDGSIHHANVGAYGYVTIETCVGAMTLVTDIPCGGSPQIEPRSSQIRGGSCSAHNDQGDTCSISCPEGQAAMCSNASGGGTPSCSCSAR
jgi:hypothetical protein